MAYVTFEELIELIRTIGRCGELSGTITFEATYLGERMSSGPEYNYPSGTLNHPVTKVHSNENGRPHGFTTTVDCERVLLKFLKAYQEYFIHERTFYASDPAEKCPLPSGEIVSLSISRRYALWGDPVGLSFCVKTDRDGRLPDGRQAPRGDFKLTFRADLIENADELKRAA
jgi:hypothetical protein